VCLISAAVDYTGADMVEAACSTVAASALSRRCRGSAVRGAEGGQTKQNVNARLVYKRSWLA